MSDADAALILKAGDSRVLEQGEPVTTVHHLPIDLRVRRLDPRAKLPIYGRLW